MNQEAVLAKFITSSYSSYSGLSGLQDYTPLGFQLKRKIIEVWRNLLPRNVHEVELPQLTPECVLKASGHLDRFHDYMILDNSGRSFRADHVVAEHMANMVKWGVWEPDSEGNPVKFKPEKSADVMTPEELDAYIHQHDLLTVPAVPAVFLPNGLHVMEPLRNHVTIKNLVYEAGSNREPGQRTFLRPELAQGIFVNFGEYSSQFALPFGISQVGRSFRQEISPKEFTRLREFTQYETEYFYDPENPEPLITPREIKDPVLIPFLIYTVNVTGPPGQETITKGQEIKHFSVADALESGIICNPVMAGFIALVHRFCVEIGLRDFRFRKHERDEMAHYAVECWDLEALISNEDLQNPEDKRWLECIGIAHRGDFDLRAHQTPPLKRNRLHEATLTKIQVPVIKYLPNFKEIMEKFNKFGTTVVIEDWNFSEIPGAVVEQTTMIPDTYLPHCIEPSLGIDRLVYAVLRQNYRTRSPEPMTAAAVVQTVDSKVWLKLSPAVCLYDLAILPLSNKANLVEISEDVISLLQTSKYISDFGGQSIGKRYLRMDSIGVLFCVTIDFQSLKDQTVVIRDRDTTKQVRVSVVEFSERSGNISSIRELFSLRYETPKILTLESACE
jgi:glycyl-tRNA synthetase